MRFGCVGQEEIELGNRNVVSEHEICVQGVAFSRLNLEGCLIIKFPLAPSNQWPFNLRPAVRNRVLIGLYRSPEMLRNGHNLSKAEFRGHGSDDDITRVLDLHFNVNEAFFGGQEQIVNTNSERHAGIPQAFADKEKVCPDSSNNQRYAGHYRLKDCGQVLPARHRHFSVAALTPLDCRREVGRTIGGRVSPGSRAVNRNRRRMVS